MSDPCVTLGHVFRLGRLFRLDNDRDGTALSLHGRKDDEDITLYAWNRWAGIGSRRARPHKGPTWRTCRWPLHRRRTTAGRRRRPAFRVTPAPSLPATAPAAKAEQPSDAAAPAPQPAAESPAPPKPWTLYEPEALKKLGIIQYGWVEQGLTFNSLSPTNRWNGPVYTNDRSNEYEMNQLWLGWERPVKTDGCGWDIGGRIDLMYGSDWRYGLCNGLETNLDATNKLYGFILPQFYLEVGYNDLTVKLGHFAPSIGYEVVAAPGNFFYSHSYALGYSEPVLVTGFQADYKLNKFWNAIAGLNEGFNEFQDEDGKFHFPGGLKWHNDEHKVSVSLMTDIGPQYVNPSSARWIR